MARLPTSEAQAAAGPGRAFGGGAARWLQGGSRAKDSKATLRRLWAWFGVEKGRLVLVSLLVLVDCGVLLCAPWLVGRGIDAMGGTGGRSPGFGVALKALVPGGALGTIIAVLVSAYAIDAILVVLQGWLMAGASQSIVASLRRSLFSKLKRLGVPFFDSHSHGDLMSRLANDVDNISSTIAQSTTQLILTVLNILGSLSVMLILSPLLTLAALVTVPLVLLLTRSVASRTRQLFRSQAAILGALNGHVEETISGIAVVKAFGREEEVTASFLAMNEELRLVGTKAQIWSGYIMPVMNVINNIGFAAVAATGGVLALKGLISVGVIASFIAYSRQFSRPLNDLANTYNTLQTAVAGAERVFAILDEAEEGADQPGAILAGSPGPHGGAPIRGDVVFESVSFSYRAGKKVLDEVSFSSPAGSVTALVGPTGAGKTTIVNLLARFYDPSSGSVRIDGHDVRDYARDSLRRCFGIVLQDSYLFSGSIRDNILYGKPDALESAMRAAARTANAEHFTLSLPQGYETLLKEGGGPLSEGQRQLLAIARAVLADPRILILDEATSSVDTRTELRIQEAMIALMRGRTSFIIAHRLSTIRGADRILVIDGGKIVESGDHEELLAQGGLYSRMYSSQG